MWQNQNLLWTENGEKKREKKKEKTGKKERKEEKKEEKTQGERKKSRRRKGEKELAIDLSSKSLGENWNREWTQKCWGEDNSQAENLAITCKVSGYA